MSGYEQIEILSRGRPEEPELRAVDHLRNVMARAVYGELDAPSLGVLVGGYHLTYVAINHGSRRRKVERGVCLPFRLCIPRNQGSSAWRSVRGSRSHRKCHPQVVAAGRGSGQRGPERSTGSSRQGFSGRACPVGRYFHARLRISRSVRYGQLAQRDRPTGPVADVGL